VSPSDRLEWLTVDEVAKELKVSRKQVYGWIHKDQLPAIRLGGGAFRIERSDLNNWLTARHASAVASAKDPKMRAQFS